MTSDSTRRLTRFIAARHRLDAANAEEAVLCADAAVAVSCGGRHEPVARRPVVSVTIETGPDRLRHSIRVYGISAADHASFERTT